MIVLQNFFFERTTLDECVSIDIAEKYNVISLGGHNQGQKKERKKHAGGLDCDINTRQLNSTRQLPDETNRDYNS